MYGTVLVGTWLSTVPNSNRHGSALLAFYDDGRGIGYYLGYADAPVYGYWLLSRNESDVSDLHLYGADKTFKNGKTTAGLVSCSSQPVEMEEEATEVGNQQSAQRFVLVSLNQNSTVASLLSETLHFVEQHCLTNTTKSSQ